MSDRFLEQRINIKFCVKLGKNASDICTILSEDYGGDAIKKSSVSEWHRRSKEARMLKLQMKKMAIVFFNIKGTVHFKFFPQGQTVNQAYYVAILKRLREAVSRKRPELWPKD
jgi:hypothetical protein